jgi:hypothetical protein
MGMSVARCVGSAIVALAVSAVGAGAQAPPAAAQSLTASQAPDSAIDVDGRLDEAPWRDASVADRFTQRDPSDGAPATERTEVRVLVSESAIYVGVRAFDSDPAGIVGRLARRDEIEDSDAITVYLDSFHDRRTAFQFMVTPRGSIGDQYSTNDSQGGDSSWDPVWQVGTSLDEQGWTAEFRIPFTQLRFATEEATWGFQVRRQIQRKSEDAYWAPVSKSASGFASLFGELHGLGRLASPARLEVRPYVVAEARRRPASTGSLYAPPSSSGANAGFDVKYGLTSDFTLDLAVNPDFGQVEADPAVVNLTAFESFFPERRPFFVEGSGLFNQSVPGGNLFYSRRIGRHPQGFVAPPSGGTVEIPEASTIVSAAKLTGKTAAGLGIGILSALTTREDGTFRDATGDVVGTARVQPAAHHFAGRVERDFADGQHTVGTMLTSLNRFDGADQLGLRRAAYSVIVDGSHRWQRNTYNLQWSVGASRIVGSEAVILAAQRSSSRYFQRPDADHVALDSTRTALDGYAVSMNAGKGAGTWRYYGWLDRRSPGLDTSDLGFLFGPVDRQSTGWGFSHVRSTPSGPFRDFQLYFLEGRNAWTTDWEPVESWFRPVWFAGNLRNNWGFDVNPIAFDFGERNIEALRGGPSLRQETWHQSFANLYSDRRRPVSFSTGVTIGGRFGTESRWTFAYLGTTLRPNPTVRARVDLNYSSERYADQWVGRETIAGSDRYVVATIRQQTLDATIRLDWTLSPRLSFQLFAQPFVSAGAYSEYLEVQDPNASRWSDRFHVYGNEISCGATTCDIDRDLDASVDASFGRPDFDVESLRMTSVLRWEFRPGSVLFVAWQHGRSSSGPDGSFEGLSAMPDLLRLPSDNTVLVKASYWLGL